MYVENITSDAMVLDNNGKAMQIKVYEDLLKEKDKEIERLKEELEYTIPIVEHNKTITKHLKENKRLNNIINELEKEVIYYFGEEFPREVNEILKKSQELKGDGSNEKI